MTAPAPTSPSRLRPVAALLMLAAAWISAGAQPFSDAARGALTPPDFAHDYVTAHALLHRGRDILMEGQDANDYGAALGAPRVEILNAPYHFHPPPALLPILPLVPLGYRGAAIAWLALSLAALAWLAHSLTRIVVRVPFAAAFGLLIAWPPVLHNLEKGQWSILTTALVAAGVRALVADRPRAAGGWLGVAASFKATPLLLLGYLLLRRRRAAAAMLATLGGMIALSIAIGGVQRWRAWLASVPGEAAAWQTWIANTASLNGFVARLLVGGPFARPLTRAPVLAAALVNTIAAAFVAAAAWRTRAAPPTHDAERRALAPWLALMVLLNPIAWTHTLILLLLPAALLFEPTDQRSSALLAASLIVATIPRQTLYALAGPVPVGPWRGMLLSIHALAALGVTAAALAPIRSSSRAVRHASTASVRHIS